MHRARIYSLLGLVLVMAALAAAWLLLGPGIASERWQTATFSEVSRSASITLRAAPMQKNIYALEIRGESQIDGESQIELILNGKPDMVAPLDGRDRFQWRTDWYATEAVLRYEPKTTTTGELRFRYRFIAL
jgi:hypothetical protein